MAFHRRPIQQRDTQCPAGYLWYTCTYTDSTFAGCCNIDPCLPRTGCPVGNYANTLSGTNTRTTTTRSTASQSKVPSSKTVTSDTPTTTATSSASISSSDLAVSTGTSSAAGVAVTISGSSSDSHSVPTTTSDTTSSGTLSADISTATTTETPASTHSPSVATIVGAVVGGFIAIIILIAIGSFIYRRHKHTQHRRRFSSTLPRRPSMTPVEYGKAGSIFAPYGGYYIAESETAAERSTSNNDKEGLSASTKSTPRVSSYAAGSSIYTPVTQTDEHNPRSMSVSPDPDGRDRWYNRSSSGTNPGHWSWQTQSGGQYMPYRPLSNATGRISELPASLYAGVSTPNSEPQELDGERNVVRPEA